MSGGKHGDSSGRRPARFAWPRRPPPTLDAANQHVVFVERGRYLVRHLRTPGAELLSQLSRNRLLSQSPDGYTVNPVFLAMLDKAIAGLSPDAAALAAPR